MSSKQVNVTGADEAAVVAKLKNVASAETGDARMFSLDDAKIVIGYIERLERLASQRQGASRDAETREILETLANASVSDFVGARLKQAAELALASTPPATATALEKWLSRDGAETALWEAIEAIKIGNRDDDKLILNNLRDAGIWLAHFQEAEAWSMKRTPTENCGAETPATAPEKVQPTEADVERLAQAVREKSCYPSGVARVSIATARKIANDALTDAQSKGEGL